MSELQGIIKSGPKLKVGKSPSTTVSVSESTAQPKISAETT